MIADPALFDFSGVGIRVLDIDGDPWFVAKDVAQVLGYATPQKAIYDHCKWGSETELPSHGGTQHNSAPSADPTSAPSTLMVTLGSSPRTWRRYWVTERSA
jgi:prophage antirepressor-like protein